MNKLLQLLSLLYQPFVDFGQFMLNKWIRNYFFLLIGGMVFLRITNSFTEVKTTWMLIIVSVIIILDILKQIGKNLEK